MLETQLQSLLTQKQTDLFFDLNCQKYEVELVPVKLKAKARRVAMKKEAKV